MEPQSPKNLLEVCKTFTFDAHHKLPFHNGKCRRDHGHTYTVHMCWLGPVQDVDERKSSSGMVVDFGMISEQWKKVSDEFLDHHSLNDVISYPTAENLCLWLVQVFYSLFSGLQLSKIRVCETPTSYVEWRHDFERRENL